MIEGVLEGAGLAARVVRSGEGDPVPRDLGDCRALVVMGGPMGVCELASYPFLREEMRLIEHALARGASVLGVCLGSQLLAATLGATVSPGPVQEIGWLPVELTAAGQSDALFSGVSSGTFTAFHWHGDVFTVPAGAVPLARSAATACQAFRYGRSAYGLLFHLEVTEGIVAAMVQAFGAELRQAGVDGDAVVRAAARHLALLTPIGAEVFRRWVGLRASGRGS